MKVLIIGGGMAGLTAATSLRKFDKHVEIIVVDPKEYIEIHWASIRAIFDEDIAAKSSFSIAKWSVSKSIKVVRQGVTRLTPTDATLNDGTVIEFNVAVIATGSQTKFPALGKGPPSLKVNDKTASGGGGTTSGDRNRRLAQLRSERDKFLKAESVLIVGGGLIGVEFAGDLAYHCREAGNTAIKITLVHATDQLCPVEFTPKAAAMAQQKLERLGVQVLLNERVVKDGNNRIILQTAQKQVVAQHVVWATGIYACNSNFMDGTYLDRQGFIEVDEYFRVKNAEHSLFAIGDCCDLLPNAGSQVLGTMNVIGKNIAVTLDCLQTGNYEGMEQKMRKVLVQPEIAIVTLGKQTGVAQTSCCHTQFVLPWAKNSTMFLFKAKQELGLKE